MLKNGHFDLWLYSRLLFLKRPSGHPIFISLRSWRCCGRRSLRRIAGENDVPGFDRLVASKTGALDHVLGRLAIIELKNPQSPVENVF
jgi:hypothetical protein